jgi:hypothetical protein
MSPSPSLRRWPSVNFLADLEPTRRDRYAFDDLALREPRLRRAYRKVQALGRLLQAKVSGPDWVRFSDARTQFQTALFELAFNLGFENGLIRTRSELVRQRHPSDAERSLGDELRKAVALAEVSADRAIVAVLGLACALADSPPPSPVAGAGEREG